MLHAYAVPCKDLDQESNPFGHLGVGRGTCITSDRQTCTYGCTLTGGACATYHCSICHCSQTRLSSLRTPYIHIGMRTRACLAEESCLTKQPLVRPRYGMHCVWQRTSVAVQRPQRGYGPWLVCSARARRSRWEWVRGWKHVGCFIPSVSGLVLCNTVRCSANMLWR